MTRRLCTLRKSLQLPDAPVSRADDAIATKRSIFHSHELCERLAFILICGSIYHCSFATCFHRLLSDCKGSRGAAAMGGLGCFVCIGQSTVGVIEKWGKFSGIAQPGLHCLNPFAGEWLAGRLSLRVQSLDVRCDTKTKDNVFVSVICSIQYRVVRQNADDAFYELQNPREQIQSYVFDVVRACVPKMILDDVFEQKNDVAKAVSEELEKVMGAYGYSIEQTLIVDVEPDPTVRRAMNEINAAQRMRVATLDKAEAEKILQVKRAEGEAEAKFLSGHGIARQRQAITEGLRESVLLFSNNVPGTTSKDVMDLVLITQYFDTMKEIGAGSKNTTVFLPHGPGHVGDISQQIRNGMMQGNASAHVTDT